MDMLNSFKKLLLLNGKAQSMENNTLNTFNVDSGAEILSHYQAQWSELHENNETNACKAAELADVINTIHKKVKDQKTNIVKINQMLAASPTLEDSIVKCNDQITELFALFERIEKDMGIFEDVIEQEELQTKKETHKQQVLLYEQKRIANLEAKRADLVLKHTETIRELEKKQQLLLEERQQVFQDAFKNDLETYKSSGVLPKRVAANNQSSALLEEIQIDCDDQELTQFLEEK